MWTVTIDDKKIILDDLSPATFQEIADRHGISWFTLYNNPAANIEGYYDLLVVCANHVGVTVPEHPDTMGDVRDLLDCIARTEEDDRPKAGTLMESPSPEDDLETT